MQPIVRRQRSLFGTGDAIRVVYRFGHYIVEAYGNGKHPKKTDPVWCVAEAGKETPLHVLLTFEQAAGLANGIVGSEV